MIVRRIFVKFHPEKQFDKLFFPRKKKNSFRHPQNGRFGDFATEPETPFGNQKIFFSVNRTYSYGFFRVKFTGNYYVIEIIT